MRRGPSGIRVSTPVEPSMLAHAIRASDMVGKAFYSTSGSVPARYLAAARALIRAAQLLAKPDGCPRFTDTR